MVKYSVYPKTDVTGNTSYGIVLSVDDRPIRVIEDISCNRDEIERLTQVFNKEMLDPVHLDQPVEDFLIDHRI